jgi:transcriptional regulator with XRE-family HTH domain
MIYSIKRNCTFTVNRIGYTIVEEKVPQEETEKLIASLKAWVDAEYGRRAQIARMLGVHRQQITNWLEGQKTPTLEQGLQLLAFLKKQRGPRQTRRKRKRL